MAPKVERILENIELGEGPHWDVETQTLYFIDIFGKAIHKYVPATKKHTKAVIGTGCVSVIVPVAGHKDKFLISIDKKIAVVTWDGESDKVSNVQIIAEVDNDPDTYDNRINDGKCDPSGRFWGGTMGGEPVNGQVKLYKGSFFNLDERGNVKTHLTKVGLSNGLAWNEKINKFYFIDTPEKTIKEYDYDANTPAISNPKVVFDLTKHNLEGLPDGMAIDTDGNLWVALFNGYKLIKIDPRKPETLLLEIPIPAKQTTSVAFGGPNLDELYVTSAKFTVNGVELPPPEHGALYKVTGIGARGYPGVSVKLNI